ncbi:FAD-dependent oxidoreductase [uncultured Ferrovibrio sp.]|mgnify:FL=1|jgi:glycine/D-amino acid oxidase-like deaminating enzyme|uniref:NAD(P)/FAD-dependent oxidoreductase n=1 Tax=uncultured Ferrovibrio sp. TaxID=1576913 RepID=UPI0026131119|nr:FAD-dependent oxidoreductase [uncultured Ferrovibrio sp.]
MKVAIVGGGIVGLSTAWALKRAGCDVSVIEQGPLPNPLGSSVDQHRLIRYPYGVQRGYLRMVREAYHAWERVWSDLKMRLYAETGTLVLSGEGDSWAKQSCIALAAEEVEHLAFDGETVAGRYPMLNGDGLQDAYYCPSGGLLFAEAIVAALSRHLRDRMVTLLTQTKVAGIDASAGIVRLADGGQVQADRILVAAGPWTAQLLPDLAPVSRPSRQVVVYLTPPGDLMAAWHAAPMLLEIGETKGFYLVPPRVTRDGIRTGLKIGDHRFGSTADPSGDREPRQDEIDALLHNVRHRIMALEQYRIAAAKTCFYDVEAEERFQFRQLGPRAFAFCGTSGHGFKFGPVIGERIAAVLQEKADFAATARWAAGHVE